jgi:glutamine amidotransferase
MGNLRSVLNAFEKLGFRAKIVKNSDEILRSDRVLLPGVGAFGDAMSHLRENSLDEALKEFAKSGKPMLGVCLGMQLLFEKSFEFGEHEGLGIIEGEVIHFDRERFKSQLKIPHMGWNELYNRSSPLFEGLKEPLYLYFVHSYHVVTDKKYKIADTHYGYQFCSAVRKENIYGLQPHPEKSHERGLKILENFMRI